MVANKTLKIIIVFVVIMYSCNHKIKQQKNSSDDTISYNLEEYDTANFSFVSDKVKETFESYYTDTPFAITRIETWLVTKKAAKREIDRLRSNANTLRDGLSKYSGEDSIIAKIFIRHEDSLADFYSNIKGKGYEIYINYYFENDTSLYTQPLWADTTGRIIQYAYPYMLKRIVYKDVTGEDSVIYEHNQRYLLIPKWWSDTLPGDLVFGE